MLVVLGNLHKNNLKYRKEQILKHDCQFFDRETMNVDEYFGAKLEAKRKQEERMHNLNNFNKGDTSRRLEEVKSVDDRVGDITPNNMNIEKNQKINNNDKLFLNDNVKEETISTIKDQELPDIIPNANKEEGRMVNNFMAEEKPVDLQEPSIYKRNTFDSIYKGHLITLKDYENLTPGEFLKYDHRRFLTYVLDNIKEDHSLLTVFLKYSLMDPVYIRSINLVTKLSMNFALNAMIFSDSYIDSPPGQPQVYKLLT
jgi:hypothetical protein